MKDLDNFIHTILKTIISADKNQCSALREQLDFVIDMNVSLSGKGVVARFSLDERAPRLSKEKSFSIEDVAGETSSLEYGFGSILFVDGGLLSRLELYTYGENWPDSFPDLVLTFNDPSSAQRYS